MLASAIPQSRKLLIRCNAVEPPVLPIAYIVPLQLNHWYHSYLLYFSILVSRISYLVYCCASECDSAISKALDSCSAMRPPVLSIVYRLQLNQSYLLYRIVRSVQSLQRSYRRILLLLHGSSGSVVRTNSISLNRYSQ